MDYQTALSTPTPAEAPKRPYVTPTLVVHGDVHTLTQSVKIGTDPDNDNGGSFIPDGDA